MSQILDTLLEFTLGAPGSVVDTPKFKTQSRKAAERAITAIAEERNNRGGGPTKKSGGKTVPDLGLGERVVTGNLFGGNAEARDEIGRQVDALQETGRTEDYINTNSDDYPELKDYDASKGMKGAKAIVQNEKDLVAGKDYLVEEGTSIARLNAFITEDSPLTPLDPTKRYTKAQLAPYVTNAVEVAAKRKEEPYLKLKEDGLAETVRSNKASEAYNNMVARNNQKIKIAEIDYQNKTNEYNYLTAKDDRDYKYRSAEADRELKKELALLGFEDKAADRRYDREERRDQNRQLLILQMMKGLQNLGSGFAL